MSDERTPDGYPQIVENPGDTEGDDGNPGVPQDYLDNILTEDTK